jgi:hypothetical protein
LEAADFKPILAARERLRSVRADGHPNSRSLARMYNRTNAGGEPDMPIRNTFLAAALLFIPGTMIAGDLDEDLLAAVRKSDAAAVKALLDKGANVNAKTSYGQTPLFFACDRGNIEIVRMLLDKGVDVNATDTFYHTTAMVWAAEKQRVEIVKLLVEKGAKDVDGLLSSAVDKGSAEMAKAALGSGRVSANAMTAALAQAEKNKKDDMVELLKAAGAKPRAPATAQVPAEVLATYTGRYLGGRGGTEMEVMVTVEQGKLRATPTGGNALNFNAINNARFRAIEFDQIEVEFATADGKVTGFKLFQGGNAMDFKRAEAK